MTIYAIEIQNNQDENLIKDLLVRLGIKFQKIQNGVKSKEMDASDYLFSSQTNKMRLLKALENADKGENLIEIDLDDLKKQLGVQ
jgi:hypothetical protein